jgi:hypothetical protein
MSQERRKGGKKGFRFGCKQKHGNSRSMYFAKRKLYLAARNKERRIEKQRLWIERKQK